MPLVLEEPVSAIVDHLRRVPLFQGMTNRAIEHVAGITREAKFDAGEAIMREGEEGTEFLVVVDGALEISRGGSPIGRLGAGDFLGEIALIDGRPRTATATALEPVKALVIERDAFQGLLDDIGAVRHGILMALTERIRRDSGAALTS
jgi:CRP/FNR family transcriptional regulator, cyclic AMP receptor protein